MPECLSQTQPGSAPKLRRNLAVFLLLASLGFLAFYPALFNFFCADDFIWIETTNDIFVNHDLTSSNNFVVTRGRPVVSLVFLFLYQLVGLKPFGYHLLSILLHILNAVLLFQLLSFLTKKTTLRLVASLIFLLHFIHEESLFWISSNSVLLCCSFYLTSLLLFLKWRANRGSAVLYVFSLFFFVLALFSREDAITFPLLVFLVLLSDFPPVQKLNRINAFKISGPFFLLTGLYLLFRLFTLPPDLIGHSLKLDPTIPLKNMAYFSVNLFFPYRFLFDLVGYDKLERLQLYYQAFDLRWLTIPFILALLFFLLKFLSHHPKKGNTLFNAGILFLCLSILPYLFLDGNGQRFLYFPLLGFSLVGVHFISSISDHLARKGQRRAKAFVYLCVTVIFLLNFALIRERSNWWKQAGLTSGYVVQQTQMLVSQAQQSELGVLSLPHRVHGAYIFLTGFEEAVAIYYPEVEGKIKYLGRLDTDEIERLKIENLYTFRDGKFEKL